MSLSSKVIYYRAENGDSPISEFLDSLDKKHQAKILRIVRTVEEYGLLSILPHVKKLRGYPLWEIRILGKDSVRVLYMQQHISLIVLLHGFIKKTNKTPHPEIQIAPQRMKRIIKWS